MRIIITSNLVEILVSDEDFDFLNRWTWHALLIDGVPRNVRRHTKNDETVFMSHEILIRRSIKVPHEVDHKDRNPFNNQFENLRPATRSQNGANRATFKSNTSGYKGVHFDKERDKWIAQIRVKGLRIRLGRFHDPVIAAKEYDKAAKRYFGDFAVLNFPTENVSAEPA